MSEAGPRRSTDVEGSRQMQIKWRQCVGTVVRLVESEVPQICTNGYESNIRIA
jgi:hypothetical protein